ncbi:MAG TPA: hypothetical protein VL172_09005 [Kofleriaceae bacterium]|nr:hypothetical protein [Kofleriaceae bacterium]
MIAIVCPEPAPWLAHVATPDAALLAPWATRTPLPAFLPARLRTFHRRRHLHGAITVPLWPAAEALLRAWTGTRTQRVLRVRLETRRLVDGWAAAWIRRHRPAAVIAPSAAAWRSFAAARDVGATTRLIEDLPDVRGLHDDLDRAAAAHPDCRFLRRYRAPAWVMVRQEAERVLADRIDVRGRYAWDQRLAAGIPAERLAALRLPPPRWRGPAPGAGRILLAGLAAARHGTVEALARLDAHPEHTLLVRLGEGAEPAALYSHPRVRPDDGAPVDQVICPSWVETYPPEIESAAAAGIPVQVTPRAAGWVAL